MADDKILSLLGFARRAGKLSMGHDAAQQALFKKQAKLVLFCGDASQRLVNEFNVTIKKHNIKTAAVITKYTMDEISFSLGYRAGVITVNDENFSKRIAELLKQEANANGNKS